MPYYCTVPRCTSMAGKVKNVSFHQFPRDEELAKLWNEILKRGKPYTKYSKVCSLHFKPEDYTITSVGKNKGQWRTLRKDAVPSQNLPSDEPVPQQRRPSGTWLPNMSPVLNVMDPMIQQQVAQAIYMQTMLAMQAASGVNSFNADEESDESQSHEETQIAQSPSQSQETQKQTNSYECKHCTKCFKDPDVFLLHQRTHNQKNIESYEKENFNHNTTLTVQANPILVNLLKNKEKAIENTLHANQFTIFNDINSKMDEYIRLGILSNGDGSIIRETVVGDIKIEPNSNTNIIENLQMDEINAENIVEDNDASSNDMECMKTDDVPKNNVMDDCEMEDLKNSIINDYLNVNCLESKGNNYSNNDSLRCDTLSTKGDRMIYDDDDSFDNVSDTQDLSKCQRKDDSVSNRDDRLIRYIENSEQLDNVDDDCERVVVDDNLFNKNDRHTKYVVDSENDNVDFNSERLIRDVADSVSTRDDRLKYDSDCTSMFKNITDDSIVNNLNDKVNGRIQRLSMLVNTNYSLISDIADRENVIFGNSKIIEGVIDFKLNDRVVNRGDKVLIQNDRDESDDDSESNLNECIESNNLIIDESV